MGLEENVRAFIARAYGLPDSRHLPLGVVSVVAQSVAASRRKGVLSASQIEQIAAQVFDQMPKANQTFFEQNHPSKRRAAAAHSSSSSPADAANQDQHQQQHDQQFDQTNVRHGTPAGAAHSSQQRRFHENNTPQRFGIHRTPFLPFVSSLQHEQHNQQNQHHSSATVQAPSRELTYQAPPPKPAVPRCGIRKQTVIGRLTGGPGSGAAAASAPPGTTAASTTKRSASTIPQTRNSVFLQKHSRNNNNNNSNNIASPQPPSSSSAAPQVDRFLRGVMRPKSQMNYATQNSFRRLQRQMLDQEWNEHVKAQAAIEEEKTREERQREREAKRAQAEQVREYYESRARNVEDKFLEREAERIEAQQWYEVNTQLERAEKQERLRKRKEEFEVFAQQAREFKQQQRQQKQQQEQEDVEFRHITEVGVAADERARRARFRESREVFLDSLKEGTQIARARRAEARQEHQEYEQQVVRHAKEVLANEKQRAAEEKERRLQRVRKHEALQDRAAQLFDATVRAERDTRAAQERERIDRQVEVVEQQHRERRVAEREHARTMRSKLQDALKETVVLHRQQHEEEIKEAEAEKAMVQRSVRQEQEAARHEAEARREKRERLARMQVQAIAARQEELLQPSQIKLTQKRGEKPRLFL